MVLWKGEKAPPLRNLAVQTVGETYFVLSMVGIAIAGILAIATVASGSTRGMFKFRLDRCDCLLTSSSEASRIAGESCTYGEDRIEVDIGWKSFTITEAASTEGCLNGWEGTTDIGSPFGTGHYAKETTSYGNGAIVAADACVVLFVVSAILSIIMYKTVKMSYYGPGSIYTIGLHNIAIMCLLLSIASGISMAAFWGRIQGTLGSLDASLAGALFKATMDVCKEDWDEVEDGEFCDGEPWDFEVPLYAGALAIAYFGVMFITSVWLVTKSSFVEGLLDGSVLASGKLVSPRAVEFEQAVGRALASPDDPDYDSENILYGGDKSNIRPYPLPGNAKKAVVNPVKALVSPLRMIQTAKSSTSPKRSSGTKSGVASPKSFVSGEYKLEGLKFSPEDSLNGLVESVQEEVEEHLAEFRLPSHAIRTSDELDFPKGFFEAPRASFCSNTEARTSTSPNKFGAGNLATNEGTTEQEQQLEEMKKGRDNSQDESDYKHDARSTLSSLGFFSTAFEMNSDHQRNSSIGVQDMPREMASAGTSNSVDIDDEQSLGGIDPDFLGDAFDASLPAAFSEEVDNGSEMGQSDRPHVENSSSPFQRDWSNTLMSNESFSDFSSTPKHEVRNALHQKE